jgi:hypothetical protein
MITPPTDDATFNSFVASIIQQESGGNYNAISQDGALGKYQVMPANVPSWSQEVLGYQINSTTFLSSPSLQDQIAQGILWSYFSKYGAAGAAAMWYSGQPNPKATYGNPPVDQYVQDVLARMGGNSGILPGNPNNNSSSGSNSGSGGLLSPGTWLSGLAGLFGISSLPDMFERLGLIILGAIFVLVGLTILGFSVISGANKEKNSQDQITKQLNLSQENPAGRAIAGKATKGVTESEMKAALA